MSNDVALLVELVRGVQKRIDDAEEQRRHEAVITQKSIERLVTSVEAVAVTNKHEVEKVKVQVSRLETRFRHVASFATGAAVAVSIIFAVVVQGFEKAGDSVKQMVTGLFNGN